RRVALSGRSSQRPAPASTRPSDAVSLVVPQTEKTAFSAVTSRNQPVSARAPSRVVRTAALAAHARNSRTSRAPWAMANVLELKGEMLIGINSQLPAVAWLAAPLECGD